MHIFRFLQLMQSALCSGLFTAEPGRGKLRFRCASPRAARALGLDEWQAPRDFCPLTLVAAFLGHGYIDTGDYDRAARLLDAATFQEVIVSAADAECYDTDRETGEQLYERKQAERHTLDDIVARTKAAPPGWSCAG